jgi:hypothetical protein
MCQLLMKQFYGYTGKLVESATDCMAMHLEVPHVIYVCSVHVLSD